MKRYLVGGAVRDELLGYPVKERDWVVVGASPEAMLSAGYTQVGKDFPVFLHPQSKDEHALARTERKKGHGYTGFAIHADSSVTLEEDLRRRDLTVNAMAMDDEGQVIDPFGGRQDLCARQLRHVSEAFTEDPLRVLRVARFAARYAHLGFSVAPETLALMRDIVAAGELAFLPVERVWVETERALGETDPQVFIEILKSCGALAALFPEVDALFGVPQRPQPHPEIDCGVHTLLVMQQAAALKRSSLLAFAALTHDLGKALTPAAQWPSHRGHETAGLPALAQLCERLRVPKAHAQLARAVCQEHLNAHRAMELSGAELLHLLEVAGALRQGSSFELFVLACEADSRGRTGFENTAYPQAQFLRRARDVATALRTQDVNIEGLQGEAIGAALREAKINALNELRRTQAAIPAP